jgi:hypothetical protein
MLIAFDDCRYRSWIAILLIRSTQSLNQQAIGLHTFDAEHKHLIGAHILDGKATINSGALTKAAGG